MRYHRVLLIGPPHSGFLGIGYEPNISLGYLSETLESYRLEHEVFDMALNYDESELWEKVANYQPDLVGVTMMSLDYLNTIEIIRRLKEKFRVDVVVGGAHMSCLQGELLEKYPEIDYGIGKVSRPWWNCVLIKRSHRLRVFCIAMTLRWFLMERGKPGLI
ncbi:MAG: cobalamin-dependent protein [Calditrichia bacterium]